MSQMLQILFIAHVVLGLIGLLALYFVWMKLLHKELNLRFLKLISATGLIAFVLSWLSGGWYYTRYYGKAVKPIIKAGDFAWAHAVFMETKEHVFLFVPFLSAVVVFTIWILGKEIENDKRLKQALTFVGAFTFVLASAISAAGVIISAAVR